MRDLAPEIVRQRLLIEGRYSIAISGDVVEEYLQGVAAALGLRTYGQAIVHAPGGIGRDENEGYDAFIPLIDSGISLYVWSRSRFFSAVLFTCRTFDVGEALKFTERFFGAEEIEHQSF